jgi:hypothetical protein
MISAGEQVLREVHAAAGGVLGDVAEDVGVLQREAEVLGVAAGGVGLVAEDGDAQEADARGDAVAVQAQLGHVGVGGAVEVHRHAGDDLVEGVARVVEHRVGADEAAAEVGAGRVLVEVGVVVDAGDLGGPLVEGAAGVGVALGAGRAIVDDVVDDAAELVDLVEALALVGAEEQERELEVGVRALGQALPQRGRARQRAGGAGQPGVGLRFHGALLRQRLTPRRG